ncbi:Erv1 / Alr family protein [Aphelenchoides avenae]|nr:Erv1 / Alr family protein [Aphelenchus avenae]
MRQVVHAVLLLLIVCRLVDADVPDWDYEPNGASAKLYRPGVDKVIQLDEETFEDTVFNSSVPVLVELYKDWCGYCRRFLPVYREFAWSVQNWKDVVKIAAINCADIHNSRVCGKAFQYGKKTVPTVKFFPPNASEYSDLKEFDPEQTVEAIRYSLVTELNNCCDLNSTLPDEGGLLNDVKDASSIWSTVPSDVSYAALVYDEDETNRSTAAEILALDLLPYKDKIAVLPTTSLSTLTNRPSTNGAEQTVALFKRGSDKPVFQLTLSPNASTEIIQNTDLDPVGSQALDVEELQSTADVVNCTEEQEKYGSFRR